MAEHSQTPWRVADIEHDHDILDADGKVAARAAHGNRELAALIVEAVNERDRLRDLVGRLAQRLQMARLMGFGLPERDGLLDEAREAVGKSMKDGAR